MRKLRIGNDLLSQPAGDTPSQAAIAKVRIELKSKAATSSTDSAPDGNGARTRAKAMPRNERRKQLLDVASKIVVDGGIGALTMEALAERAGVSKPVVYEHWDNSEAVGVALLEAYFQAAVEVVDGAARDSATLGEYLSHAIDAQFEFHRGGELSPWVISNGFSSSTLLNDAYRQLRKVTLQTFEDLLVQQGAEQQTAEAAGFILAAMMNNAVYEFGPRPDSLLQKETLKVMINGALGAILPLQEVRPQTPERTLATYRSLKDLHER